MRPGTYLLVIAPHCVRDAARAWTVKNRNKNDSRYLEAVSIQHSVKSPCTAKDAKNAKKTWVCFSETPRRRPISLASARLIICKITYGSDSKVCLENLNIFTFRSLRPLR